MSSEQKGTCVETARGIIDDGERLKIQESDGGSSKKGGTDMRAQIGKQAPDFEATAYVEGSFKNIKLSDYKGRWVSLCFYPGDFTFV